MSGKAKAKRAKSKKGVPGYPVVGKTYIDYLERNLEVTEIVEGDPNGREVRGILTYNPTGRTGKEKTDPYSCTLKQFGPVWNNKRRPATTAEMAANEKENERKAKGGKKR